ncbi:MAG: DUF1249 domain-containing protein [Gammaproteobacteria bacterium]|nr:DUF1249 domain-containing protein [Gammaproteobacteria bacterium]
MLRFPPLKKRLLKNSTAVHEANFAKLARVIPDFNNIEKTVSIPGPHNTRLELQLLETSKFTRTFSLRLWQAPEQHWLPPLHLKIRNYYDASVTEVLAFQHQHRLDSRYRYPNPGMYQRDEKWQINQFLGEWLDHCLRARCIFRNGNASLV